MLITTHRSSDVARLCALADYTGLAPQQLIHSPAGREVGIKMFEYAGYVVGEAERIWQGYQKPATRTAAVVAEVVAKPKRKSTDKPVRAKLLGYSITSVIRWMGAEGWEFDDVVAVLTYGDDMVNLSDVTIRLQLKAGRDGSRGPAAPVTPAQAKQLRKMSK